MNKLNKTDPYTKKTNKIYNAVQDQDKINKANSEVAKKT